MRKELVLGRQKRGLWTTQCSHVPRMGAGATVWKRDRVNLETSKQFSSLHTSSWELSQATSKAPKEGGSVSRPDPHLPRQGIPLAQHPDHPCWLQFLGPE